MNSPANSDRPPSYHQVLTESQEYLKQPNAPHKPAMALGPITGATTIKFPDRPITIICPYCGYTVTTLVEEENGGMVFLLCILIALFGFIFGCCLIPFCISDLKDKIHFCPRCQKPIGKKTLL